MCHIARGCKNLIEISIRRGYEVSSKFALIYFMYTYGKFLRMVSLCFGSVSLELCKMFCLIPSKQLVASQI
jgi:hypothetical protein